MISDPFAASRAASPPRIVVEPNGERAAYAAYCAVRGALEAAAALRGYASFAFSGGSTPRVTYAIWAERAGAEWPVWSRLRVFQVDERAVPPDHEESNWRLAAETFLAHVPPEHAERMRGEAADLEAEANRYGERLRADTGGKSGDPALDSILLGVGEDGHVASLFPDSPALRARHPVAVSEAPPPARRWRLTLTPPVILAARSIAVLVTGERKAFAVRRALEEPGAIEEVPARLVSRAGSRVTWFLDREAASRLS